MHKLLIILLLCSYITCDDICEEDGLYINPGDNTSYYECNGGKPTFMRCPRTLDGYAFKEFNGKECTDNRRVSRQTDTKDTEPDYQDQQPEVTCPFGGICPFKDNSQPIADNRLSIGYPECPSGSTYDSSRGKCRMEETVDPRRDIVSTDYQSRFVCPSGSTYDTNSGKCRMEELVDPIVSRDYQPRTVCPIGYTYDYITRKCQTVRLLSPLRAESSVSGALCPSGSNYDYSTRMCKIITEVDPTFQCEAGYTYNSTSRKCQRVRFICPNGQIEDPRTGECIPDGPLDCRKPKHCYSGYILDNTLNQCCKRLEIPPVEVPGIETYECLSYEYTYDRVMKECRMCTQIEPEKEIEPDNVTCPEQFVFISETRKCRKIIWIKPIFNYALCICPQGFEWRPRMFKCVQLQTQECKEAPCPLAKVPQTHICPIGQSYDFTQNICRGYPRVPPKPPKTCPAGCPKGFTQDPISGNCSAYIYIDPIVVPGKETFKCRPDYEYDPILHKCVFCRRTDVKVIRGEITLRCPNDFILDNTIRMCTKRLCMPLSPTTGQLPCYCPAGYEWRYHMFKCIKIFERDCIDEQCPPVPTYRPYNPEWGLNIEIQ